MLRACRRLLRPGGRIGYYTIFIPQGLPPSAYRRASRSGPAAVASRRRQQDELLRSAGFVDVTETDVSAEFLSVARALLEARSRHPAELRRALGETQFQSMVQEGQAMTKAIEAGLLRRSLLVAERPR